MQSEFEAAVEEKELDAAEEPRDRTKLVWVLVVAVFAAMIGVLWVTQKPSTSISQVRAKHILIAANMSDPTERQQALVRAKELRQRLLQGADFERMAKEYSNDPLSSQRGGDLGYTSKGAYEPTFDDYIWSGPLNEISDIIRTGHGYHIIVVTYRNLSPADKHEQEILRKEVEQDKTAPGDSTPGK